MQNIPSDPAMLLSFVNMKLRDQYDSLEGLCQDLDIDMQWLTDTLRAAGFEYNKETSRFW